VHDSLNEPITITYGTEIVAENENTGGARSCTYYHTSFWYVSGVDREMQLTGEPGVKIRRRCPTYRVGQKSKPLLTYQQIASYARKAPLFCM